MSQPNFQHITVPADGEQDRRQCGFFAELFQSNPIIPYIEGDGTGHRYHAGDDQGGRCRGGQGLRRREKNQLDGECYAGEKATSKCTGPDVWLPEETLEAAERLHRIDQGAA